MNRKSKIKILSLSIAVLAVFSILIATSLNKGKKEAEILNANKEETNDSDIEKVDAKDETLGDGDVKEEVKPIEVTAEAKKEINTLINEYYGDTEKVDKKVLSATKGQEAEKAAESIAEKREGIEKYNDVKTIIKPGLKEGTYFAFTTYYMKLFHIKTEVPGMSVVYVITDSKGALAIEHDTSAPDLQDHINKLSQEKEIKTEIERVNTELASAVKEDATLKDFIDKLQKVSK
jgi:hypothetical protein